MKPALFESPRSAYQLHYYLCFGSKRNKPVFTSSIRAALAGHLNEICDRCEFHLLEGHPFENNVRLLLSLRPDHAVAVAVQKIKGNLSRMLCAEHGELKAGRLWSRGYFAKSTGKVEEAVIAKYICGQAEHHGFTGGSASLVCGYDELVTPPALWFTIT